MRVGEVCGRSGRHFEVDAFCPFVLIFCFASFCSAFIYIFCDGERRIASDAFWR